MRVPLSRRRNRVLPCDTVAGEVSRSDGGGGHAHRVLPGNASLPRAKPAVGAFLPQSGGRWRGAPEGGGSGLGACCRPLHHAARGPPPPSLRDRRGTRLHAGAQKSRQTPAFPGVSENLSMLFPAPLLSLHLLATGGVATNVSRGGSGWWGCRSPPHRVFRDARGRDRCARGFVSPGLPLPADRRRGAGRHNAGARPRHGAFSQARDPVRPGAALGCGAGRKSHYLPTTGVDDCPAPPPASRDA